jgi:hypothetical protein
VALPECFSSNIVPLLVRCSAESCVYLGEPEACYVEFLHRFVDLGPVCVIFHPIYIVEKKTFRVLKLFDVIAEWSIFRLKTLARW